MARNEGQIALRDGAPKELAEKCTREKLWMQKTVFDILAAQAAAHPDRIAIKDHKGAISYGALKDRIERAGQFYRSIGIKRGDVVTIQLPNRIEFAVAFIALEPKGDTVRRSMNLSASCVIRSLITNCRNRWSGSTNCR